MKTLTWLHLSDLHACTPKYAWDAERVIETLVSDLRHLQKEQGLRPDLLFFTGDLAFGEIGSGPGERIRDQFDRFAEFLSAVRVAFDPEIELENVFLVPGNHDVNRRKVSRTDTFWLDQQNSLDPVLEVMKAGGFEWQRLVERLEEYGSFLKRQGMNHLLDDQERLIWSSLREVEGVSVGIAGFNTAWSCGRAGERGRLWMAGKYQQGLLRPKIRDADFSIALMHHPPDWLVEYETPDFGRGLEQDFRFLLHGHEHRDWVLATAGGYTVLAGGACYEWSESEHNGYNLVRLNLETGIGEVWLRRYESIGGGWVPRIISGKTNDHGVWPLKLRWLRQISDWRRQPDRETLVESDQSPQETGPGAGVVPEGEQVLARYLQRLRAAHRDLPLAGFESSVRVPIQIDSVYIPLQARPMYAASDGDLQQVGVGWELADLETERAQDVVFDEALALARRNDLRGAIVLGNPGSGKTTLLKHFVLASTDPLIGPAALGLPSDTVPVLIELRRLRDPGAGLKTAIEQAVAMADVGLDPADFANRLLWQDHLLVLVDGLDEIADPETRVAVSAWLEDAIEKHLPGSTFVVTSRYAGYKGKDRFSGRFLELHMLDVEEEQARKFISAWYGAVEARAELGRDAEIANAIAAEAADDLASKIFDAEDARIEGLRDLARNPLMLQILCLVHRDSKQLTKRRVELYRQCVRVLLELWREAKDMPVDLDAQQALRLLQPIAYWLHSNNRRVAPLEELLPHLEGPLSELQREPGDGAKLLRAIRDQTGVLVSLGQSEFGFLHQSFQEYLSALHVQDRFASDSEILGSLAMHFGKTWWREVILLALGLDNPSLFEPMMAAFLARGVLPRDLALADDCLKYAFVSTPGPFLRALAHGLEDEEERYHALRLLRLLKGWETIEVEGNNGQEIIERLAQQDPNREARGMALELLGGKESVLAVEVAAASGIGWERIHDQDKSVLMCVPGGNFSLGESEDNLEESKDLRVHSRRKRNMPKPKRMVRLESYWIGKYPVTNEQYAVFLSANPGYGEPRYWYDKTFNQPQQPVVGVSWWDAKAYCEWANLQLPSEEQWEAAARGSDGHPYPWGKKAPSESRANFGFQEGGTTAVGSYPAGAGPYGTLDQAGNVWEWCLDEFNKTDDSDEVAVRGGSWDDSAWYLHAAVRRGPRVGFRVSYIGFRVCLAASSRS